MKTDKLLRFALKQTVIIVAVSAAVPTLALISTLLLATVSTLFCEQLAALMTLTVVGTAITLAFVQFRGDTSSL